MKNYPFAVVKQGDHAGEPVPSLHIEPHNVMRKPLWWQERHLQYTVAGYGKAIPTQYVVRCFNNRWCRVYCTCDSNIRTLWIVRKKQRYVVHFNADDISMTRYGRM